VGAELCEGCGVLDGREGGEIGGGKAVYGGDPAGVAARRKVGPVVPTLNAKSALPDAKL